VFVSVGGQYKEYQDVVADFLVLGVLAVLLVYMVMAAQYESLVDPLVIMFSVPFAATGVVWSLALAGSTVNLVSLIGLVLLVGIVVNNAIVLVDYTNLLRARGLGIVESAREAGRNRLRPVLMTTLTTIFGLLPLAFARGEGSEVWRPLGITVLGGLTVSTLITLVFIPTLYTWAEEIREWHRRRRGALQ
jgi:HAE1 family hydrophobic/amphiphilic exporter-1